MLRIETETDGARMILRLIGRISASCVAELRERVENRACVMILDLAEVHLVDLQQKNKDPVLEAFDTLFNKRDYATAENFWSSRDAKDYSTL